MPVLPERLRIVGSRAAGLPLLPAATHELARSLPMPKSPRFDIVRLPLERRGERERVEALTLELIERRHRVIRIGWTMSVDDEATIAARGVEALARARVAQGIETAVTIGPESGPWATVAETAATAWGWPKLGTGARDYDAVEAAVPRLFPRVSIVIVTHNNLEYLRLCLASLIGNTDYPNVEIIVVDNAAGLGTWEFISGLARADGRVRLIRSADNLGFAAANNLALREATGSIFVVLNDDTMVARGWLTRLVRHLREPKLGIIGAATNRTCNEAQVATEYQTYGEFVRAAHERARDFDGERRGLRMVAMFCAAFRRAVWEQIGPLDERFAVGLFEDEDYAYRLRLAGFEIAFALDVLVHHAEHASIGWLVPSGDYGRLFAENRTRFEQKWGISWTPHRERV